MIITEQINEVFESSTLLFSISEVDKALDKMSEEIHEKLK
jgi:hypothetical protein